MNLWIKQRRSNFYLHHFQQLQVAEIQLPLLLLFPEMGVVFPWLQRKGGLNLSEKAEKRVSFLKPPTWVLVSDNES